jgi:hypothetical protein
MPQYYGVPTQADIPVVADPAALTAAVLTDSSGGVASQTLAAITGSYVEATIENTVASLADEINKLVADVTALRTTLLAVVNALQGNGLVTAA